MMSTAPTAADDDRGMCYDVQVPTDYAAAASSRHFDSSSSSSDDDHNQNHNHRSPPNSGGSSGKENGGGSRTRSSSGSKKKPSSSGRKRRQTPSTASTKKKSSSSKKKKPKPSASSVLETLPPPPAPATEGARHLIDLPSNARPGDAIQIRVVQTSNGIATERSFGITCPQTLPPPDVNGTRQLLVVIPGEYAGGAGDIVEVVRAAAGALDLQCREAVGGTVNGQFADATEESGSDEDSGGDDARLCEYSHRWQAEHSAAAAAAAVGTPSPSSSKKKKRRSKGDSPSSPAASSSASTPAIGRASLSTPSTAKSPTGGGAPSTYVEMAHDAILNLKDYRTGSSVPAILKYMMVNFHAKLSGKKNVKNHLMNALKLGVKAERFIKIRNSFKLNKEWVKKEKAVHRARMAEKKRREKAALKKRMEEKKELEKERIKREKEEAKKKKETEKARKQAAMTTEEREELERKRAEEKRLKEQKAEEARQEKLRQERIRKRRFPMDDLKLIAEDLELKLPNPPEGVVARPDLPRAFDSLDSSVIMELLQVYHFLHGDLHYCSLAKGGNEGVAQSCPEFTMKHLASAVAEIDNGNAKRAKCIPPLLSHLFTMLLRVLMTLDDGGDGDSKNGSNRDDGDVTDDENDGVILKYDIQDDLEKLESCLTPASWSEVLRHYMGLMDRVAIDKYTKGMTDFPDDALDVDCTQGYYGYLGHPECTLHKTVRKLATTDAWDLTAEEITVLLKVLCDDVLSSRSYLSKELSKRGDDLYELFKAKKAADSHYRKMKLAYEGPKWPKKKGKGAANDTSKEQSSDGADGKEGDAKPESSSNIPDSSENIDAEKENAKEGDQDSEKDAKPSGEAEEKKHVPTVSKKEYEEAEKERDRATELYEKGLRQLVSRTEPIGHDRNDNAVFVLPDCGMILIECKCKSLSSAASGKKSHSTSHDKDVTKLIDSVLARYQKEVSGAALSSSTEWYAIEMRSLFDSYMSSLDTRGVRELALHDALTSLNARRLMYDDIKERNEAKAAERQLQEVERRLQSAREAVQAEDASGRRSGRLASLAQVDLAKIEHEMKVAAAVAEEKSKPKPPASHRELTGLEMICNHDIKKQKEHLKTMREKGYSHRPGYPPKHCPGVDSRQHLASSLWRDGGVFDVFVSELEELDSWCATLAPRVDSAGGSLVEQLKDIVIAWRKHCVMELGPVEEDGSSRTDSEEGPAEGADFGTPCRRNVRGKRTTKSTDNAEEAQSFLMRFLDPLKQPLLDLESRVYHISGLAYASLCAEEANDHMSVSSSDGNTESDPEVAWKKIVHKFNTIPTSRSGRIREMLIQAIAVARGAGLNKVVEDLRGALKLYRTGAAGATKAAALKALEQHGGYEPPEGEDEMDMDDDDTTDIASLSQDDASVAQDDGAIDSSLNAEALALSGSLRGDDAADRDDWRSAVRDCKTVARFAALVQAFVYNATPMLLQMQDESHTFEEAIKWWQKSAVDDADDASLRRSTRGGNGNTKKKQPPKRAKKEKYDSSTEVWVYWRPTNNMVWGKTADHPWWPSHVCDVIDKKVAEDLDRVDRVVICRVGDERIHVVKRDEIRKYSSNSDEDLSGYDEDMIEKLTESIEMARRIRRGKGVVAALREDATTDEMAREEEEKKSG